MPLMPFPGEADRTSSEEIISFEVPSNPSKINDPVSPLCSMLFAFQLVSNYPWTIAVDSWLCLSEEVVVPGL
jgi:hypothetical protein